MSPAERKALGALVQAQLLIIGRTKATRSMLLAAGVPLALIEIIESARVARAKKSNKKGKKK